MLDVDYFRRKWNRFRRYGRKPLLVFGCVAFVFWLFDINQHISETYVKLRYQPVNEAETHVSYLINTPGCQIMEMDPYGSDVKPFLREKERLKCPPSAVVLEGKMLKYSEAHPNYTIASCCYSEIHRVNQNQTNFKDFQERGVSFSRPCRQIPPEGLELTSEFARVTCEFTKSAKDKSQEKYYFAKPLPLHRKNDRTMAKEKFWAESGLQDNAAIAAPSVLIFMIKAVSRNSMIRKMPETRKYLLENDFIDLKGMTKTSDQSIPDVFSMLTGLQASASVLRKSCYMFGKPIDHCPFIWKNFSEINYVTGFIEDAPGHSSFSSVSRFVKQPTDYYGRPVGVAYMKPGVGHGRQSCVGGITETELVLNYTLDFVKEARHVPYFFLSAHGSIANLNLNTLGAWDTKIKEALETVTTTSEGQPHEPVIIFLSDQGQNYGFFRTTILGQYEEALPFAFIRIPHALKKHHPAWYQRLRKNANNLVHSRDIHATLEDILHLAQPDPAVPFKFTHGNWESPEGRSAFSLFEDIPETRTCKQALIPREHCRCGMDIHEATIKELHDYAADCVQIMHEYMTQMVENEIKANICVPLEVDELRYMRFELNGTLGNIYKGEPTMNYRDYALGVGFKYTAVHFEGFFRIMDNGTIMIGHEISTLGPEFPDKGPPSTCIADPKLQPFCLCRDYYEKITQTGQDWESVS